MNTSKNNQINRLWFFLLVLFSLLALIGCGSGGSSQLNNSGPVNNLATVTATCTPGLSSGVTCLQGRFVDDVVSGLHYSCSDSTQSIQALTDPAGTFSCPSDSGQVDFYLTNQAGNLKIDLGVTSVVQTSDSSGLSTPGYLVVTPRTLAGDEKNDTYSNYSLNVSRLLYLMDPKAADATTYVPDQVVSLDLASQEHLTSLLSGPQISSQTITVLGSNDFSDTEVSFNQKVAPLIAALGRTMPTQQQAQTRLDTMLNSTRAGLYTDPAGVLGGNTSVSTAGFFGCNVFDASQLTTTGSPCGGASNTEEVFAQPYLLYDRAGRTLGFAVTSLSNCAAGCANSNNNLLTNPLLSSMATQMSPFSTFSRGGLFQASWTMPNNAGNLTITQGRLWRDHILDDVPNYQNTYGAGLNVPMGDLGQFKVSGTSLQGSYALLRVVPVAPTLDPKLWPNQVLPLFLNLTFMNTSSAGSTSLSVQVTADGNIVTDLNQDCAPVDPVSLINSKGVQELPVGVVANILAEGTAHYITPILLFPKDSRLPTALQGVVVGADNSVSAVRLRLDVSPYQYQVFGNSLSNGQPLPDGPTNPASWFNLPLFYQISSQSVQSGSTAASSNLVGVTGQLTSTIESCH